MVIAPLSLRADYWDSFNISTDDLDFLYNHLLEIETPLTTQELVLALVNERIKKEKQALENRAPAEGKLFIPKEHYHVGETLVFPALGWNKGKVISIRPGNNPEIPSFDVLTIQMEHGGQRAFAAGLQNHRLNEPIAIRVDDPLLDPTNVMRDYGERLVEELEQLLRDNPDLVKIAGRWFPRALLVDVNVGHLNLAEAALDMAGGGPLPAKALLEQIDLPTDVNTKLTEFSLNLALQEDDRFDEVGPAGEVLWYLKRLEPEAIQRPPIHLRYNPIPYDPEALPPELTALEKELDDELSVGQTKAPSLNEAVVSLNFPHWRVGTLPLSNRIRRLFPTSYEAQRIQFFFVDGETGERFPGWVTQAYHYAYGLREYYQAQNLIPGSLVHVQKSKNPGEVVIRVEKRRAAREWIRTILVGADEGIVYAMLKQVVSATFDERMATFIPDLAVLDAVWEKGNKQKLTFEMVVANTMRELAKLNPQGHVHAQELYAAVNIVRRSPPGPIFSQLIKQPWFIHVGDLYYRLDETVLEEHNR